MNIPEGIQEYKSLKPVVFNDPEYLILTTMPSVDSHLADFYFADTDNRFWPTLGAIFNMPYQTNEERLNICKENHIAIWSVVQSCLRHLSREDTMQDIQLNDVQGFLNQYPTIKRIICVSHRTQSLLNDCLWDPNVTEVYVPSPSAADLWYDSVDKLLPRWSAAFGKNE